MCNDFGNTVPYSAYVEAFSDLKLPIVFPEPSAAPNLEPRDEIWPGDTAPIIRQVEGGVSLTQVRWGLDPGRAKAPLVINMRSEGREFMRGRCLVPCSHYYEFTGTKSPKTRWRVTRRDGGWFCFAGLLGRGTAKDEPVEAFSLLTCEPGPDVAGIHDRQPVVLDRTMWSAWLDQDQSAKTLLQSTTAGSLHVEQAPRATVTKPRGRS